MKFSHLFFAVFLILLVPNVFAENTAIIYKNESCGHCSMYLAELKPFLQEKGFKIVEKNFVNDIDARIEWLQLNREKKIPISMQGHLVVSINGKLILEGHVPMALAREMFEKYPLANFPDIVLYQDLMVEEKDIPSYRIMSEGKVTECKPNQPVSECAKLPENVELSSLFWLVLVSGILAGIHPCTIGVLLFFLSFLFTIGQNRKNIIEFGGLYVLGIFLAYLLIGLGVLKAVVFFGQPHFAATISGILIIILGLINVKDFFFEGKWINLGIPKMMHPKIHAMIRKTSLPAAFIVGLLVGVCSFGCTAGIYFSIIGLLLAKATYVGGLFYLVLYNVLFILPLIAILVVSSNKKVVEKISNLERHEKKYIKLLGAVLMIAIGIYLLFFSV